MKSLWEFRLIDDDDAGSTGAVLFLPDMHGFRQKNDKIDLRLPKREAQTSYVIDFTGNNFLALKPRRSQEG